MNKKIKILIIAAVLFIAVFIGLSIFVSMSGKSFIEGRLEKGIGIKTEINSITLSIPLTVNIAGLKMGELLQADRVSFRPSILSLFAGKVVLSNLTLINPEFSLELSEEGRLNLPKKDARPTKEKKGIDMPFYLTALNITNGRFEFTDKKILPQGYKTIASGINVNISKQMLPPASLNTKFRIEADIVTPEGKPLGAVFTGGWIDFGPKNMDASFEIRELELTYFSPYYGDFLSKKKLLSAKLTAISDFKAENNDLAIATELKLHNLVYAEEEFEKPEGPTVFDLAQKTLDFFFSPGGDLDLHFTLNTRLDEPRITIKDLKRAVLQAALRSLGNQSPQDLIRKGKELYEQFKDFGDGLEDMF